MDPYEKHLHNLIKHLAITQCGHCGNKADMKTVASYEAIQTHTISWDRLSDNTYDAGYIWELALCPSCSGINLRQVDVHWGAEPEIGMRAVRVVYPSVQKSFPSVPHDIDKAYQEALKVRHISINLFALSLRRVIEGVCLERGASGRSLYEQLNNLAERNEIPAQLVEVAQKLRLSGNIGAHFGKGELTFAEAEILDELCVAILEYIYVISGRLTKLDLKLKELKNK